MDVNWKIEYLTGIDHIDSEHQRIISYAKDTFPSDKDLDLEEFIDKLETLLIYIQSHFKNEEDSMADMNYGLIALHKKDHDKISDAITGVIIDIKSGKSKSISTYGALGLIIMDWSNRHFKSFDRIFADFCRASPSTPE